MSTTKPWKQPEKVGKLIEKLMSRWQGQTNQNNLVLNKVWQSIVGDTIAQHTTPEQIFRRKLIIKVESSAWMNELTFLKNKIKIQAKLKLSEHGISVDDVIFRLG